MTECYCFDIDGVLADHRHRTRFVTGAVKNWAAYHAAAEDDVPIADMVGLARVLAQSLPIVYVTARPGGHLALTERWLKDNGCPDGRLVMRDEDQADGDDVDKSGLIARVISEGWAPRLAFDDRPDVVVAWQRAGVTALLISRPDIYRRAPVHRPRPRVSTRCKTRVRV